MVLQPFKALIDPSNPSKQAQRHLEELEIISKKSLSFQPQRSCNGI